ncbi:hypothetical protein B0I35DRAFT_330539, partial [Stachybotrys elegans]
LAALAVALRFITRGYVVRCLGGDDWMVAVALVCATSSIRATNQLSQGRFCTLPLALKEILLRRAQAVYFTIIFYNISLTLAKISVLVLYLRIFETSRPWGIYPVIAGIAIYGLWSFFSSIFYCSPIAAFWDVTIIDRKCLPNKPTWFTTASLNILTDFAILILPLPVLKNLQLGRRKKVGFFSVCIISVIRLHSLYVTSVSTDPTWDNAGVAIWSCIELNVAIICACLTTLRPLITRLYPRLF